MRCQPLDVYGAVGIWRLAADHEGGRAERSVLSHEGREKPPQERIIQCYPVSRINDTKKVLEVQVIRLSIHTMIRGPADEQIAEGTIRRCLHLDSPLRSLPFPLNPPIRNGSDELWSVDGMLEAAVPVQADHQL